MFFEKEALLTLKEFGINPYDTVFYKPNFFARVRPLSVHFERTVENNPDTANIDDLANSLAIKLANKKRPKLFICRLHLIDGLYTFTSPEVFLHKNNPTPKKLPSPPEQIRKYIFEIEKKLLKINNAHSRKLMAAAKKDKEFVERFNGELFFKHSFYQGNRISSSELSGFYNSPPYNEIIDLSSDEDRRHFISLYSMAFYNCSLEDLYTIDGIFSVQPERHTDNAKKTAGNSVFNLILRNDKAEITQILSQMGEALSKIQPPRVNLADASMLSKNYSIFIGITGMAQAFAKVAPNIQTKAVSSLIKYKPLIRLCEVISILDDEEDYRESNAYKKCSVFL